MKAIAICLAALSFPFLAEAVDQPPTAPAGCAATLKGKKVKASAFFLVDPRMFVDAVDGNEVEDASDKWQERICLAAGRRHLGVRFSQAQYVGVATADVEIVPDHEYEIEFDGTWRKGISYWIRDLTTGQDVTEHTALPLENQHGPVFLVIPR